MSRYKRKTRQTRQIRKTRKPNGKTRKTKRRRTFLGGNILTTQVTNLSGLPSSPYVSSAFPSYNA